MTEGPPNSPVAKTEKSVKEKFEVALSNDRILRGTYDVLGAQISFNFDPPLVIRLVKNKPTTSELDQADYETIFHLVNSLRGKIRELFSHYYFTCMAYEGSVQAADLPDEEFEEIRKRKAQRSLELVREHTDTPQEMFIVLTAMDAISQVEAFKLAERPSRMIN